MNYVFDGDGSGSGYGDGSGNGSGCDRIYLDQLRQVLEDLQGDE